MSGSPGQQLLALALMQRVLNIVYSIFSLDVAATRGGDLDVVDDLSGGACVVGDLFSLHNLSTEITTALLFLRYYPRYRSLKTPQRKLLHSGFTITRKTQLRSNIRCRL